MDRDLCEKIKSSFWKSVLKTWLKHNKGNHDVPHTWVSTYLWHNKDIKYKGKPLFFPAWAAKGVRHTEDLYCDNHTILTMRQMEQKIGPSGSLMFEYNAIITAINNCNTNLQTNTEKRKAVYFKNIKVTN